MSFFNLLSFYSAMGGFLIALLSPVDSASGPHINDLNVLLPPLITKPVEYRLQGTDGCFSWSWDHHDILYVQPEYNGTSHCSTSARIISIAPYGGRKESAVYATDIHSGTVIRCEVFIDKISRIQIFHHSVKLDLDGLATLQVRAFDDEDNIFSSLAGLRFMWHLMPKDAEVDEPLHRLVHVPLKDTPLSDCGGFCGDISTQIKIEDSGVGSDLYVVRGIGIGHEIVAVHLLEPHLEHVQDTITLTIVESMSLDPPSPVLVIIGACVHYSLRVLRKNTPQAIPLPSQYHIWSVVNSSVALVDPLMGIAYAQNLGITNIIVEDIRVAGHQQISSMHVVMPDRIVLFLLPITISSVPLEGREAIPSSVPWYLVVGQDYVVHLKVFSPEYRERALYITKNEDLKLEYDKPEYWVMSAVPGEIAIKHGWLNCTRLTAISEGIGKLSASLTYHSGNPEESKVLCVMQEVQVCNRVTIFLGEVDIVPSPIRIPWAPGVYQEVDLKAIGGCAISSRDYRWFSSDKGIVSVSASGYVQAKRPGQAIIKVESVFDSLNYDEVVIEVLIPSSMVVLPSLPVEAMIGTHLPAAVTMRTLNGEGYHKCDAFSSAIRWQVSSGAEVFQIVNSSNHAHVLSLLPYVQDSSFLDASLCAWTLLYASKPGRATLHAIFSKEFQPSEIQSSLDKLLNLKASTIIAAYSPLVALQAGDGNQFGGYKVEDKSQSSLDELYLVPGTGIDIFLVGGPERWHPGIDLIESVDIITEQSETPPIKDVVVAKKASSPGQSLYRIFCQTLGKFKLFFSRGNSVEEYHPFPAFANVEVSLFCSFPSSIILIVNEPANLPDLIWSATQAARGPGRIRVSPITVMNGCTIRLAAVSIHKSGKPFANSSSLSLNWELSSCDKLAYWEENSSSSERFKTTWERFLVLQNESGLCMVRATVVGISEAISEAATGMLFLKVSELLESAENRLADAVQLQLVSSLRIVPESILLFFHPDAKVRLSILGGTCDVVPVLNVSNVVQVIQEEQSPSCKHLMLGARGLGSAVVTVRDVGLSPPVTASALVRVASLDWIKILLPEEISLLVGTRKTINLEAGTDDGTVFDPSQYSYMNIRVHLEDGLLELVSDDEFPSSDANKIVGPSFVVYAVTLGMTTLHVSARLSSGRDVLSQTIKVEVYAPLRINPRDVFLVPGASYVLAVTGGPGTGNVEYASMDETTATVQRSSGQLLAVSPGNTSIRAAIYDSGSALLCEAYGTVNVGIPSSMYINFQSEQLAVGREMSIYPTSSYGDLFSFYELCKGYKWMIEDEQVLGFQMSKLLQNDKHEASFSSPTDKGFIFYSDSDDMGFINTVYGRFPGRTKVNVSFSCDFVYSGHISHTVNYNASEVLWVIADPPLSLGIPITWVLPPFYTSSTELPMSSEASSHMDSRSRKGNIVYSVLKSCCKKQGTMEQDSITINRGRVVTMGSNVINCIQAKDRLSGRIEIASCVRVAEVAQVRINIEEFPSHIINLAVGASQKLAVNYHDSLGIPFFEAGAVPLSIDTNHPDVVSILNLNEENYTLSNIQSIHLKALHYGRALVRISINNNPKVSAYVLVSVGAYISPQNPVLQVGCHVNFTIIGKETADVEGGQWLSANESIISIDRLSGEAQGVGEGATQVFFKSRGFKLQISVTVKRADAVLIDAPSELLTNVPSPGKGYEFSVRFSGTHDEKFEDVGNNVGVLYDCHVDPAFIGYTKPWRDPESGKHFCLFIPYSPEYLARTIPQMKATRPDLESRIKDGLTYISITASPRGLKQMAGSAVAALCGGFVILEKTKLNLTPNSNTSIITIVGNTDIQIHWHARDLMSVTLMTLDEPGIGGRAKYEIKVIHNQSFTDKLIVTLPATGQGEVVDISYESGKVEEPVMRSKLYLLASFACVLAVLLLIVLLRWWGRQQLVRPSNTLVGPTEPITPKRQPITPINGVHTPPQPALTTPVPFTEYVRQTMDGTPHLRRGGRRRFNPLYTY
ncbi:hypothetical protein AMTR_s00049p00191680 [Amborella trichopoda]|uniref:BIG2 domain-containing protein n=3 Tax=Amborella trichopoda TaxID=13333 RepID=W1PUT2_AMBTC|nr:hypothetical protein AMTR_s00049p00191680 [Amborella trichopoda]